MTNPPPTVRPPAVPPSRGTRWPVALLVILPVLAVGGFTAAKAKSLLGGPGESTVPLPAPIEVEVVTPRAGGIDRVCVQPGTVEPFEAADLYAKVSGFLIEQVVDIGARVKKDQVLARIWVPEYQKQHERQAREIERARARVEQARAVVVAAEADERAARAAVGLAESELRSKGSYRKFRATQRDRLRGLLAQQAIDAKLVDEQEDQHEAAVAAELAAQEAVTAAKQRAEAAKAKVTGAKADEKLAEAEVTVAEAEQARVQVLLDYAVIRSPYDGVVTRRSFNRGDFVRSADAGGSDRVPVLCVERTDLMRVVVQVPDRDVPYVSQGDPAVVEIDALPNAVYKTEGAEEVVISRSADSEDPQSRTMRTEVDVKNRDGRLRRGMYGRVTMTLQPGNPAAVRVPSSALVGRAEGGRGSVRVVRDGKVRIVPVRYATDSGVEAEIVAGLSPADEVVVHATGPVGEGTAVTVSHQPPPRGR